MERTGSVYIPPLLRTFLLSLPPLSAGLRIGCWRHGLAPDSHGPCSRGAYREKESQANLYVQTVDELYEENRSTAGRKRQRSEKASLSRWHWSQDLEKEKPGPGRADPGPAPARTVPLV